MKISQWLHSTGKYLAERRPGAGRLDAEAILKHVTGRDRVSLYREADTEINTELEAHLLPLVERRAGGEPLAYIIGSKEFMGLEFAVSPAVLIPRPETEMMVEKAVELLKGVSIPVRAGQVIADVGTGSGAVAVSIAVLFQGVRVYAVDISGKALEVSRQNAATHGVGDRVQFLEGNLLDPLAEIIGVEGRLDLVTANLPYIPSADIPFLMADVREHEPRLALDGGEDGLEQYRRLVPRAGELLSDGGYLLMEIAPGQGKAMRAILGQTWAVEVLEDLAGRERLVIAKKY
ncbi:MAG: SAM-dependent methyltransferase [Peptococcaceae bacterium BICA1-7]|nr:MAG: SAM-dependent methyltransferase [Peptococcaceae bacterium BICA1-7]